MSIFTQEQADKVSDDVNPVTAETYVKLFCFLPFLKIETRKRSKTFFLFYILPFFRCRNKEGE